MLTNHSLALQKSWLALGLDMDGSFINEAYTASRAILLKKKGTLSLAEENELLISHHLVALTGLCLALKGKYERLFIILASKRQDYAIDQFNSKRHGTLSAFQAISMITNYLKDNLPESRVEFIPFLMPDLSLGDKADFQNIGKTFQGAEQALLKGDNLEHPRWKGVEHYKFTTLYAHAHYFEKLALEQAFGKPSLHYCLLDDLKEILHFNRKMLENHADLMPKGMFFNFIEYHDHARFNLALQINKTPYQGSGKHDPFFMQTLRKIEEQHATPYLNQENALQRLLSLASPQHAKQLIQAARPQEAAPSSYFFSSNKPPLTDHESKNTDKKPGLCTLL